MKIQLIEIAEHKNLKNIKADTTGHNGLTVLIGNNASGKSNFIEALSRIFYNQYNGSDSGLTYTIGYKDNGGKDVSIKQDENIAAGELPKRVVAVYSGEEDRLWKRYYQALYDNYIKDIIGERALEYPRMIYLNKFYWHISLLCLLCSDAPDVQEFIKTNLGIDDGDISIRFVKGKADVKNSTVRAFAESLEENYTKEAFKEKLDGLPLDELFYMLYIAFTPKGNKLIEDIIITFNDGQTITDLSEGQKKQLLIKGALEFAAQDDSLFLFDEPDAHVHLANKKVILEIIQRYISNRHVIITTHSPTLCKESMAIGAGVLLLREGTCEPVADAMEGAKYLADSQDIIKLLFSAKDIIIVEGKMDDKYLTKALQLFSDEYPELSFEFLRVGGSDGENVSALLDKIEPPTKRKIIVLSDRDTDGLKVYRKLFEDPKREKADVSSHKVPKRKNTYYLMIPPLDQTRFASDFVVEDYFSKDLIKSLAQTVFAEQYQEDNSFKNYPQIKDEIKRNALPDYCRDIATATDMVGFKTLLSQLSEIVKEPIE